MMGRILKAIGLERREANPNDPWAGFHAIRSGTVTPDSAQSVGACYAAVGTIAEAIGSLPLHLYRRDGDNRTRAADHPLYATLHHTPNEHQSAPEFREWMTASMLLTGNAYARIVRGWDGQCRELVPLVTERVTVLRKGEAIGGYEYTDRDGKRERLLPAEVFHLRHRAGSDPLVGVSPITAARAVIQLAQAEAQHGQATFDNGTRASGILSLPGRLKPEQRTAIAQSWQSQYAGGANAGKVPILEEGTSFTPISLSLEDSDWVAARRFSVEEVARIFKIPPVLIGDLSHANYSNSTEMFRWFVAHTLKRHMAAWEGAITRQLLTPAGARLYYPEFNAEGMLRGDHASRAAFYSSGIAAGWMLPSEARKLENLPVIEGIDDRPPSTPAAAPGIYPSKQ